MTPEITRVFEIDMGHRLMKHEGKCKNVHGHRYRIELSFGADHVDEVGRVIDFGVIKQAFGSYLDEHFDHALMLQKGDPLIPALEADRSKCCFVDFSPTVENLAKHWFAQAVEIFSPAPPIVVTKICVFETPNCWAVWTRGMHQEELRRKEDIRDAAPHT